MDNKMNIKLRKAKIALTIPTGRPNVKKVVRAFLNNAKIHGYDLKNFSVYLAIDLEYEKTLAGDFRLPLDIEESLGNVVYIFEEDRNRIARSISSKFGLDLGFANRLFAGRGYSQQRNSVLLWALKEGNDFAICVDDDESPFVPVKSDDGDIEWKNLDFFTPHLEAMIGGADVTRGPYLGYISPIPSDFEKDIPEEIRRKLGEALKFGSEIIAGDSFLNLMNKIRYLPQGEIDNPTRPFNVESGENGKPILSGNMGINLKSLKDGKVPLFYNPPKARGEDAIFALQLGNAKVVEVDSYIFHDPFGMYPGVFNGRFPKRLRNIPVTLQARVRFSDALTGWLKYAPVLINMTSSDSYEKKQRIGEMLSKIGAPTKELAVILDCPDMNNCRDVLFQYSRDVEVHLSDLAKAQKMWRESIIPSINEKLEWDIEL